MSWGSQGEAILVSTCGDRWRLIVGNGLKPSYIACDLTDPCAVLGIRVAGLLYVICGLHGRLVA